MPAKDFAPEAVGQVDPGKVYLIKGTTLKKLLVEVRCNASQFDVAESETERIYTYRNDIGGGALASGTNLNLTVRLYVQDAVSHLIAVSGDEVARIHMWRQGIYQGWYDEGTEAPDEPDGSNTDKIIHEEVAKFAPRCQYNES